jgi:predicted transcriptional regulator with HTH domain
MTWRLDNSRLRMRALYFMYSMSPSKGEVARSIHFG